MKDVGKIIFTNLYVVYRTNPKDVNDLARVHGDNFIKGLDSDGKYNNNMIIKDSIGEAELVLIAWGKGKINGYSRRVQEVKELINGSNIYCVKDLTKRGYPRHPRTWSYLWPIVKV